MATQLQWGVGSMALALGLLGARSVRAQEAPVPQEPAAFGAKGQVVITTDAAFSVSRSEEKSAPQGTTTRILLRPAIDYFVASQLSTGAFVGFEKSSTDFPGLGTAERVTFEVGSRVGYAIPLSERFAVWPKLGVSFSTGSVKGYAGDSAWAATLNAFVPFEVIAAPHFLVGLGPDLDLDFAGERKRTVYSLHLTIGGWL